MKNKIILLLFFAIILLFAFKSEKKQINRINNKGILSMQVIGDTVINKVRVKIIPILLKSCNIGNDEYKIYANYAFVHDTFNIKSTFASLGIVKNSKNKTILFKENLSGQLIVIGKPNGFKEEKSVDLIEIKDMATKTFSLIFNTLGTKVCSYAFFEIGANIAYSDTKLKMLSCSGKNEDIVSENNSFNLEVPNQFFSVYFPVCLKKVGKNILIPTIDTGKAKIDGNFITFLKIETKNSPVNQESTDSICLYPKYKSTEKESVKIPVDSLKDIKFIKATRYYELNDLKDIGKLFYETGKGMEARKEDIARKIINYNTKWFLYIETDKYKGWVSKIKDFEKLGFIFKEIAKEAEPPKINPGNKR